MSGVEVMDNGLPGLFSQTADHNGPASLALLNQLRSPFGLDADPNGEIDGLGRELQDLDEGVGARGDGCCEHART